ncbi:lactonase family protein [Novosphingobium sp. SG720]|uniref:lactonase family protein n=1 Tax=Novosphingobium sp. SG720 TaxID=2586998 RepID=UPI001446855D|nr:lactonase family protein [Novosphingobium sp. SG720]NKJ44090.1 6-phosphogluconolactonase (cycloisomerase 2 family) [Novosphingobium sp. SG720]
MDFKVFAQGIALALGAAVLAPLPASAQPLLVGGYTGQGGQGIAVYDFDPRTGTIVARPLQVEAAGNPSWLTLSADGRHLYAVNENGDGQADPVGRVSAYRLDPRNGRLAFLNRVASLGAEPTHASLSRDGRFLFIANYSVSADPGGTLAVAPVLADGRLAPVIQVKTHHASLVDADRQASAHVHSAVSSPDGRFVFAQDLGADRIYAYRYDPAQRENPLSAVPGQPFLALPPGSGPRHLVFAPGGHQAYVTLEMAGAVAVLDYAEGHLAVRQVVPLAPAGFAGKVGAAALHLSPDGRFLAVTDRGTDNHLVSFAIDPANGTLTQVDRRAVEGIQPREFAFAPDGRFVLVANQGSNAIAVFRRDPQTGVVGEKVQTLAFSQPSALLFPR